MTRAYQEMDCARARKKQKKNEEEILTQIDVTGECSTTESFDNDTEYDKELAECDCCDELFEAINRLCKEEVRLAMEDQVQVIIDLAIEAYELRKKNEEKKKEYKLVQKNVKTKK